MYFSELKLRIEKRAGSIVPEPLLKTQNTSTLIYSQCEVVFFIIRRNLLVECNLIFFFFWSSSDSLPGASDTSYSYKLFAVTEITWGSCDEPEKLWTAHVGSVVKDTTGVIAVNTFSLFCHLYKSTRRKFYSLTRECCNYLVEDKFRDVAQHFSNTLEFLVSRGECPFVCIDTETLNRTKLLERHKFCVLELHSHFANYAQRSERTLECLDDVKLALKRSSVGSHHEKPETRVATDPENHELRQVQLCRCMYKAHFQFLLFCSTYARLLESLVQAARQAEVSCLICLKRF